MKQRRKTRIAFVCHNSFVLRTLYRDLFVFLDEHGFECEAIVGDADYLPLDREHFGDIKVHVVPMVREPAPLRDLASLFRLILFFIRNRYDVLHVSTPKAAFLAAIAGRLTGHGRILFVVRTRVYEDMTGWRRRFYSAIDRAVCGLSSRVAPISREMGEALVNEGSSAPSKVVYFGRGSSNGINIARFERNARTHALGQQLRQRLNIPADSLVALFIGRLAEAKGVDYLPALIEGLGTVSRDVRFIIAGPVDWRQPVSSAVLNVLDNHPKVTRLAFQPDPVEAYAASDLLLFPSIREGFGNVALEAQSMGVPVVGFDIPGVREAVANGVTGLLAPLHDQTALVANAVRLAQDDCMRELFGKRGAERTRTDFANKVVWHDIVSTLRGLAA